MTTRIFTHPFIGIDSNPTGTIASNTAIPADGTFTDISSSAMSCVLEQTVNVSEGSPFGSEYTTQVPGRITGNLTIEFYTDYGATEAVNVLIPLLRQIVRVKLRPNPTGATTEAQGATNPEFMFDAVVAAVPSFNAGDDIAQQSVSWPTTGLVRFDAS